MLDNVMMIRITQILKDESPSTKRYQEFALYHVRSQGEDRLCPAISVELDWADIDLVPPPISKTEDVNLLCITQMVSAPSDQ